MSGWHTAKLEEVAEIFGGGTPSRQEERFFGGSIAWATPTDITALDGLYIDRSKENITEEGLRNSSTKLMPAGAVLLTSRATIGFTAVSRVPICTNQGFVNFVCGPDLVPEFLAYWLRTQKAKLIQHAGGTTFKEIARGTVRRFEISFPSIDKQRRLVDILSRAEGIVCLRREAQKKAAELIPALFLDMFGDPATNPKGWPEVSLGSVIKEFRYGTSQKSGSTGYPTLRIPNVIGNRLDPSEIKFVAAPDGEAEKLRLREGDLLFVRTNGNPDYVGRSAVFNVEAMRAAGFDPANCLYASYLIRGRVNRDAVTPHYLQAFLSSVEGRRRLKERCRTSAGQYNINIDGLSSIALPLPPLDSQLAFESRCPDVFSIQSQQETATQKAQATFDALLARTFGGL